MYEELGLATFSDADVDAVVKAHGSLDVPSLDPQLAPTAGDAIMARGITILDAVAALARRGYAIEAERVLGMLRARLEGDYLQTAAIFDTDMRVLSALTDPNDYAGPGTGYRMSAERRAEVAHVRQERTRDRLIADQALAAGCLTVRELGPAPRRPRADEVVIGLSPAFAVTSGGRSAAPPSPRRCASCWRGSRRRASQAGWCAWRARSTSATSAGRRPACRARWSGSGCRGRARRSSTAPISRCSRTSSCTRTPRSSTRPRYRALGRNAARYARGAHPEPVLLPESSEPFGPRYHARVVALVAAERACVRPVDPVEVEVTWN